MEKSKKVPSKKPNRTASRGKFNKREFADKKDVKTRDNDPSWYLVNGQLAKDVANFSFNNATGDLMTFAPNWTVSANLETSYYRMPGIATVITGPAPGIAVDATSPINVAARNIYSFVRHANSGHSNYDPNDLMTYLLAMDSIQTYWSYLVRLYGIAQTFQQRNRYIGDALMVAMGANAQDVRAHICELRAYINQYAIQASVLAVPNTMSYYLRHAWMYQNVYCDEDNPKAQLFMYAPAYLYQYAIMDNGAGGLQPKWLACNVRDDGSIAAHLAMKNYLDYVQYGNELLNAVLAQEDVGIMSGDILKAYGSEKLYRFNQIDEGYAIAPVYSEEVLAQFHNLSMAGRVPAFLDTSGGSGVWKVDADKALSVTQDNSIGKGILLFTPAMCNCTELGFTQILDFWQPEVTPEMALVASRNKMTASYSDIGVVSKTGSALGNSCAMQLQSIGSEVIFDITISVFNADGSLTYIDVNPHTQHGTGYNTGVVGQTTKFNQFPLLRGTSTKTGAPTFPIGEVSNYTLLNHSDIYPMHNAALLSMFGVPYQW